MAIVAHWFKRRRSTALGVVAFVSSVGGTVFPVIFQSLKGTVGYVTNHDLSINLTEFVHRFKWTMRIIAFILMFVLVIMNLVCNTHRIYTLPWLNIMKCRR